MHRQKIEATFNPGVEFCLTFGSTQKVSLFVTVPIFKENGIFLLRLIFFTQSIFGDRNKIFQQTFLMLHAGSVILVLFSPNSDFICEDTLRNGYSYVKTNEWYVARY